MTPPRRSPAIAALLVLVVLATLALVRFSSVYGSTENVQARARASAEADAERDRAENNRTAAAAPAPAPATTPIRRPDILGPDSAGTR